MLRMIVYLSNWRASSGSSSPMTVPCGAVAMGRLSGPV
jgi:hypothetical protein